MKTKFKYTPRQRQISGRKKTKARKELQRKHDKHEARERLVVLREWKRLFLNITQRFTFDMQIQTAQRLDTHTDLARQLVEAEAEERWPDDFTKQSEYVITMMTNRPLMIHLHDQGRESLSVISLVSPDALEWEYVPGYNAPDDFGADLDVEPFTI